MNFLFKAVHGVYKISYHPVSYTHLDVYKRQTLYVPDTALEYMIPGRYVDVRVIPGRENLFAFVLDSSVVSGIS